MRSKQLWFEVKGTHCASCEVIIEREIIKMDGVRKVIASHTKNQVQIFVNTKTEISETDLQQRFLNTSYLFKYLPFSEDNKEKNESNTSWNLKRLGGMAIVIFVTYKIFQITGFLSFSPNIEQSFGLFSVFSIGLVAAVSSCTAVVGGLVATVSTALTIQHPNRPFVKKLYPHLLFNGGRLIGFVFFGALIGFVGQALFFSPTLNGLFILIIAFMMVTIGINLLEIIPKHLSVIHPPKWLTHRIHELSNSSHPIIPFLLGAFTFFLPCGFTQSMQLFVLSLGSPIQAGILMGVFALGTIPALFGIGALTSLTNSKIVKQITKIAGVIVIVLGISNLQSSLALLGWSTPSFFVQNEKTEGNQPDLVNGKQYIQMNITTQGTYDPSVLTVVEGIPVQWEIYGPEFMGCANSLILQEFGVRISLKTGKNIVMFTPTKTGSFVFSCSMGMVRGTMNVISTKNFYEKNNFSN